MQRILGKLTARKVATGFIMLGVPLLLVGYCPKNIYALPDNVLEFFKNVGLELVSIAISVLVIDYLVELRQKQELRARLIRELGSRINSVAVTAAVELKTYGWLGDGSVARAYLRRANLRGADLKEADLTGVVLRRAILRNSKLYHARLIEADLRGIDLSGAYVGNTEDKVVGADFTNADLYRADLSNSDFFMSDFNGAKLDGSKLHGAILKDARNLDYADLKGAFYDTKTTWPKDFDPVNARAISEKDESYISVGPSRRNKLSRPDPKPS